ncbi:MAG: hypothetical protein KC503_22185 [Myxococcales bacterium]|nr:hypothetical protein [Myxococcales bacterium]
MTTPRSIVVAALAWLLLGGCVAAESFSHVAGSVRGFADGPAEDARFSQPSALASVGPGRLYIADQGNHAIRLLQNAQVTTLAGNGVSGFADGRGAEARFSSPTGIALDVRGLVVADRGNHRIRRVETDGTVTTIAGAESGFADGDVSAARFAEPTGVAIGPDGEIYVADRANHRVRVIEGKTVRTLAGTGARGDADGDADKATFDNPLGVAVSADGKAVYVIELGDASSGRLRRIADGKVTTVGVGALAGPAGIALDSDGNAVISEADAGRVQRVVEGSLHALDVERHELQQPTGLAVDAPGNVFVADYAAHKIWVINGDY